jgi:hypothetical protein
MDWVMELLMELVTELLVTEIQAPEPQALELQPDTPIAATPAPTQQLDGTTA